MGLQSIQAMSAVAIVALACACSGGGGSPGSTPTSTPTTTSQTTASPVPIATATINPAAIPLGGTAYGKVSGTTPAVGSIYSCTTTFNGGGASQGPWVNSSAGTWNSTTKLSVQGNVAWPAASNSFVVSGSNYNVTTNDEPFGYNTGTYPIAPSDPAYTYDQNPNSVGAQSLSYQIPLNPTQGSSPLCLPMGPIGVMTDGVTFYNALDALGRDAAAYELLDTCKGHPSQGNFYHYHTVPGCITDVPDATGHSMLFGYAFDGFGLYGPLGTNGVTMTDGQLDVCHGHTHAVTFHGTTQAIYHYHATVEYPYTVGCFRGSSLAPGIQNLFRR